MLGAYLLAIGLTLLVCGIATAFKQATSRSRWVRAEGVIVGSAERPDTDDPSVNMHFARIAFSTPEGRRFEFISRVGETRGPTWGRRLGVKYDPEEPSHAVEDAFVAQWGFATALCGLGALSLCVAALSSLN